MTFKTTLRSLSFVLAASVSSIALAQGLAVGAGVGADARVDAGSAKAGTDAQTAVGVNPGSAAGIGATAKGATGFTGSTGAANAPSAADGNDGPSAAMKSTKKLSKHAKTLPSGAAKAGVDGSAKAGAGAY